MAWKTFSKTRTFRDYMVIFQMQKAHLLLSVLKKSPLIRPFRASNLIFLSDVVTGM